METLYDRISYPGTVYNQAHISRLASIAYLHGVDTPPVRTCRVLELGCNRGLHLIGMAMLYPEAQFVGVDVSETAIAQANELVETLELTNISFRAIDVLQLTGSPGECDYLIAHGLYSWVPENIREKILELCGHVLADNGVAYLSFNTYPGWHLRRLIADMIRIHTEGVADPTQKVQQGATLIATLLRSLGENNPYTSAIKAEIESLLTKNPVVALFDEFSSQNSPVYISEFLRRAKALGLQYLGDSELGRVTVDQLPAEARDLLDAAPDVTLREQYTDFFRLTRFRHTILCRENVAVDRENLAMRLARMYIASPLQPFEKVEINDDTPARFVGQSGVAVTVNQPFVKAVLVELAAAWPARLQFSELRERAAARVSEPQPDAEEMLTKMLMRMLTPALLEVDVNPYSLPVRASEKPVASRLARLQATNGTDVVSMRHNVVDLDDPLARTVLRLLDGTKTRADIVASAHLLGHELTADQVEAILQRMTALSLLVA
jgi:methyltransferase-like protein